ncbi:MAG: TnpV protein [Erysipelotrichaceae bacterium]
MTCLTLPAEKENNPIGIWKKRHRRYLKEYRKATYTTPLISGKLNSYLADIDRHVFSIGKADGRA